MSHEAFASTEILIVHCLAIGEATGKAAAIKAKGYLSPRKVHINPLQEELRKQSVAL
jgi:hypothetical protein